jgi:branched-chain amino acid transport system ATP-binding protein
MLMLKDVHTYYGRSHILQGVSLSVQAGQVVCLVGRNGAGKTTTLHTIMGFTPARSGKIIFEGTDLTQLEAQKIGRLGLNLVPEDRRIFPKFTVLENLKVAQMYAQSADKPWTLEKIFEFFPMLEQRKKHKGNELSGGEQQMLAIGRALMANPKLLLLDEPSEGLAPLLVKLVRDVILRLKEMGTTVLLVEQHNLDMVLTVGDFYYVLVKGQIIYRGERENFVSRPEIRREYLGV